MDRIKTFFRTSDWESVGVAAFYGYFAINILMKALAYDHGDNIYKFFFIFAMSFWAIKIVTTRYTLREIAWIAVLLALGLGLSVITKQNTWLLLFMTIIAMKNCRFELMIQMAVYIRVFCLAMLVIGSTFGVFDIGYKTTPDSSYVEIPVYSFAMNEPNTAFLAVFLTLLLLLYYNYKKLNVWWFAGTSATALLFYKFTYCRTGIAVFFFVWALIIFEKIAKDRWKVVLALSVPVGAVFSLCTMLFYDGGNSVMRLFFVKTNHRRGGFIENIYMKNVASGTAQRVLEIDTEVLYQWKDLVPTYEKRITRIDGIYMDKVTCESADAVYELKGNAELPVKNVRIKDVKVGSVKKFVKKVSNVENVVEKNVTYQMEGNKD